MAIPDSSLPGHAALHARVAHALDRCLEEMDVDFKQSAPWPDLKTRIIPSAQAMGNLRDGGLIIVGLAESGPSWLPTGIDSEHLKTFQDVDNIRAQINSYSSPPVHVEVGEGFRAV